MAKNIYKRSILVPSIKILSDILAIELAVAFSFWFRFYTPFAEFIPYSNIIPAFRNYLYFSFLITIIYLILFGIFNSYRTRIFSIFSQDIPVIFKTCTIGILLTMSLAFMFRGFSYSRVVFVLIFVFTLIFLLITRALFHRTKKFFFRKGFDILNVCLLGSSELLPDALQKLKRTRRIRFNIKGYLSASEVTGLGITYFGPVNKLTEKITGFDALILAFVEKERHLILEILKATEGKNIDIFFIPDLVGLITSRFSTIEGEDFILLQLKSFILSGWQGFLKRIFDLIISCIIILLLSPLMLLIALLIKISSNGPVFYRQERVGLDGLPFKIIKFRSMQVNAEAETGPVWAKMNDSRVTFIGGLLRRTSLDELPQLWNVLKGEMSLVGPRPERPHFVDQFESFIPKYQERHRFRSGITGWAQVNGLRGQSPIEERTKYDIYYIENWSLWFDLKILILTMIAIFRGENAY